MEQQQSNSSAQIITEDDLLDYIIRILYSNLDKNEMHLEKEILAPLQLDITEKQVEHLRELLIHTNLVKSSLGFGKAGFLYLTSAGIQFMKKHKNYRSFLHETNKVNQPSPTVTAAKNHKDPENGIAYDDMAH